MQHCARHNLGDGYSGPHQPTLNQMSVFSIPIALRPRVKRSILITLSWESDCFQKMHTPNSNINYSERTVGTWGRSRLRAQNRTLNYGHSYINNLRHVSPLPQTTIMDQSLNSPNTSHLLLPPPTAFTDSIAQTLELSEGSRADLHVFREVSAHMNANDLRVEIFKFAMFLRTQQMIQRQSTEYQSIITLLEQRLDDHHLSWK
ncbi:hypothetical protein BOTBODRAFT_304744 [Botryobasidium botryosum FD-172 SS1]|uniref:Uncharacterized protein n=1 Tax=Botryobasidium botryosum (strain FD-172 SS1) TaxID=930990 RepID=A0A067LR10_BOTB1|nr:hypothetical protein BOTBODRAFT_304744 [Botryobasidium botryosum FD-172 SS1]